jgi:RIO-like serine/threonine protein kinase
MDTTLDLTVLRAIARLSRKGMGSDLSALAVRAGGSLEDVRGALGRLSRAQLVDRSDARKGVRLTMAGLAIAVASGAAALPKRRLIVSRRRAA